jgi:hypothetical protein
MACGGRRSSLRVRLPVDARRGDKPSTLDTRRGLTLIDAACIVHTHGGVFCSYTLLSPPSTLLTKSVS